MTLLIKVPRPHLKRVKGLDSFGEINRWISGVDERINEILLSLEQTSRGIAGLTRSTGQSTVGKHGSMHRPATGTDPLATGAPTGGYGTTAAVGTGDAFLRNDAKLKFPSSIMDTSDVVLSAASKVLSLVDKAGNPVAPAAGDVWRRGRTTLSRNDYMTLDLPGCQVITPEQFGAVGDGVTDDRAAIQAAIDVAKATGTQGIVQLARGRTYGIASQINLNDNGIILRGGGRNSTTIKALAAFPINTAVVQMGKIGGVFGTRLQDVAIDCNNIAGSIGVLADGVQEGSGCDRVQVLNGKDAGFRISTNDSQQAAFYDLDAGGNAAAFIGLDIGASTGTLTFIRVGCSSAVANTDGVKVNSGSQILLSGVHVESATNGVHVIAAGGGCVIENFVGHLTLTNAVRIETQNVTCIGINANGATNTINDTGVTPNNVFGGQVEFYNVGADGNRQVFSTNSNVPWRMNQPRTTWASVADPASPSEGDFWRNAGALKFRRAAATMDLTTQLMSTASNATLTLTDDTLRTILTSSLFAIRLSASGGIVMGGQPGQFDFYQTDGATIGLRVSLSASVSDPFTFVLPTMTSTAATGALFTGIGTYSPTSGAITSRFGADFAMRYDGTTTDLGAKKFFGCRFFARITAGSTVGNNAGDEVGGAILGSNVLDIGVGKTLANWYTVKPEYSNWTISGALTRAVAYYHPGFPAGTAKWFLFNNSDDDAFIGNDNAKLVLGTGSDAEIYYDGVDLIIDPDVVGTGSVKHNGPTNLTGDVTIADAKNVILNTTTGTKIGTATTQKLAFHNAVPIVQETVTGSRAGNAALADLLTKLANKGLIVDGTSA